MKDSSTRQLEQLAKRFLLKHGVVAPPVPLVRLVKKVGAELRVGSFRDAFLGFYIAKSYGLKADLICINTAHPRTVQRWALAHEMSHLLLANPEIHVGWSESTTRKDKSELKSLDRLDILADQLAIELLLPKHMLAEDVEQPLNPHNDAPLKRLASKYQVSLYALISRLEQVGLLRTRSSPPKRRVAQRSIGLRRDILSGQSI
jgi:hypothetical protein